MTKVLASHSDRMKEFIRNPERFIKTDEAARPSGHVVQKSSWAKDNGGAIPPNVLQFPNSESNTQYLRYCKLIGTKSHPARFPIALPDFFIRFLTEPNDLVVDIFGGSNTTGRAAENHGRRWKSFELSGEYVAASSFRFCDDEGTAQQIYPLVVNGESDDLTKLSGTQMFMSI